MWIMIFRTNDSCISHIPHSIIHQSSLFIAVFYPSTSASLDARIATHVYPIESTREAAGCQDSLCPSPIFQILQIPRRICLTAQAAWAVEYSDAISYSFVRPSLRPAIFPSAMAGVVERVSHASRQVRMEERLTVRDSLMQVDLRVQGQYSRRWCHPGKQISSIANYHLTDVFFDIRMLE